MADLPTALYRAITRGRSPATEGRSLTSMVHEVQRTYGTKPPPGIGEHTWRRMRNQPGWKFKPASVNALRAAQRRVRLAPGREARLRVPRPPIEVYADVKISEGITTRWLHVGRWPDPPHGYGPPITGMLRGVLDAWLAGDDGAAADRFMAPISNNIGTPVVILDVHDMKLG